MKNFRRLPKPVKSGLILFGCICGLAPLVAAKWAPEQSHAWLHALASNAAGGRSAARPARRAPQGQILAKPSGVTIQAAKRGAPFISIADGHAIATNYVGNPSLTGALSSGNSKPLALASADLDEDGTPDLISGYAAGDQTGIVTIHRGNVGALWPYGAALRNGPPTAFFPEAQVFAVPEQPDFLVVGDFNADGHWDVAAARLGGDSIWFLPGDGHGGLGEPQRIGLPGPVTAMTSGEVNRPDGLTDIVVGVATANGAQALVFESPAGALRGAPEAFNLPSAASALALGPISGGNASDIVVACGNQLLTIHGRDRKLSSTSAARQAVAPAQISQQSLRFAVKALATGHFSATTNLAAMGDDGAVHLLENAAAVIAQAARTSVGVASAVTVLAGAKSAPPKAPRAFASARAAIQTPEQKALLTRAHTLSATRTVQAGIVKSGGAEWTVRADIAVPSTVSTEDASSVSRIAVSHISTSTYDDLVLMDRGANQIHILSDKAAADVPTRVAALKPNGMAAATAVDDTPGMALAASLDVSTGSPAAVLPMRLNQHGTNGLVILATGRPEPNALPPDPPTTFVVNTTEDLHDASAGDGICADSNGKCSLRAAIEEANAEIGGASFNITFNIPTSDPNYNPTTGVFTIHALSEGIVGSGDFNALPTIFVTMTIDGYTQPGASPNTLPNGDNAVILIQIDGDQTSTQGNSGLLPDTTIGTVIRGFSIINFDNPQSSTSGGITNTLGGIGIDDEGLGGFDEGNFLGVDATGETSGANSLGILRGQGTPPGSSLGTTIGGTTPQARNIISGNAGVGVSIDTGVQIQGNFVGLDLNGTKSIPNGNDGILVGHGNFVTIGGTLAGARNVLSGNIACNIDINSKADPGVTANDLVQGNFIGTDVTGTELPVLAFAPFNCGVEIGVGANNNLIGGTSPAARNIISGNLDDGIALNEDVFDNLIQGNYIGLDATGSVALANSGSGVRGEEVSGVPPYNNDIGGTTPGAGNVISGNAVDGILFGGSFVSNPIGGPVVIGNSILGNFIGTDATGLHGLPNQIDGITLTAPNVPASGINVTASNETIGGTEAGAANVISFNARHGVEIDGPGSNNSTVGNTIQFNGGAGVRVFGGTGNLISRNSIYGNGALGIDVDVAGPNANSHCQSNTNGANNLENAPVLTAGTGAIFVTATATDPNNNTSEFSNAVAATQTGNLISLLGTFDGLPNTTFTIEFFSSPTADPSGFGQGQTFLGSATITTPAGCSQRIAPPPVDITTADVGATLAIPGCVFSECLLEGPGLGNTYSSVVTNNGPATAHNVVWTDTLPATVTPNLFHTNQASCCSIIQTTSGSCTVSGQTVTCNLGTMPAGGTATINVPFEVVTQGSIQNSASVTATEVDPNLTNNNPSFNNSTQPTNPVVDHVTPSAVLTGGPDTTVVVYGLDFLTNASVNFFDASLNETPLTVTGFFDNQLCGTSYCTGLQVTVPAALLTTSQNAILQVVDPGGSGNSVLFPITTCSFTVTPANSNPRPAGVNDGISVTASVPGCSWTASSSIPWAAPLDQLPEVGNGSVTFAVAPNTTGSSRSGNIMVAGQSIMLTQAGGATCDFSLNPPSINLPATGGSGSIGISSGSGCFTDEFVDAPWISQGTTAEVTTSAPYTVGANTGPPRSAGISIGGEVFTVNQAAASSCWFTLSSNSTPIATTGGTGSVAVTASQPSCAWTASSDSGFATITSGSPGTGNGTVQYSVAANTSNGRTANITVGNNAGSSATLSLPQASAYECSFAISPASAQLSSEGGGGLISLTPSFSSCIWQVTLNNPDSLQLTTPFTSGSGFGTVGFAVTPNPTTSPRTLTMTVGCQTFTVTQAGAASSNPVPTITSLAPPSATAGDARFTLTVNGTNFVNGAFVSFNGNARTTAFVNSAQVTATILASDIASAGSPSVTVTNPSPGGGPSNSLPFTVNAPASLLSTTTSVTSNNNPSVLGQSVMFTATVTPQEDPEALPTGTVTFKDGTITLGSGSLTSGSATLTTSLLAAGSHSITAVYGGDSIYSGSTSSVLTQVVNNPMPVITPPLVPASAVAGSAGFTLTVNGMNFVNGATVTFGGTSRVTTFVNSTQVTVAILAGDIASAGTPSVILTNPGPGGGPSNSVSFTVNAPASNPVPVITSLAPPSSIVGGAGFMLTVNGTNFVSGATATFGGVSRVTSFVSATQVMVAVLASDIAATGMPAVVVTNPSPGGGASNSVAFAVNNPVPTITSLSPSSAVTGGAAFTLTVNGANFVASSVVDIKGSARTTAFVSATQLTAQITAGDIAMQGASAITVVNPAPGGGTSNSVNLTVTDFSLTNNSGTQTVTAGQPANYTINTAALGGAFPGTVTLSVSGLPEGTTGSFNPPMVSPGSSNINSTLTVTTTVRSQSGNIFPRSPNSWPAPRAPLLIFAAGALLYATLLLLLQRGVVSTRFATAACAVVMLFGVAGIASGCNGGFPVPSAVTPQGTPAGNYTLTVTGTSGAVQHSITVNLTVQ